MAGGKKKRGHPDVEEVLARPFCYYCERDFDDLKILISHQKAKHFKCERCGRRLNTVGGLSVHMNQVHKETLTTVENALGNRAGLDYEIFGMEGIPEDVVQAHNQRIIAQFYQAEAERRAATGNPGSGTGGGAGPAGVKKPKFESPSELKKRLAEHKARMAEQTAAGGSSGGNTPGGLNNSQSPAHGQSPGAYNGSPYVPPQTQFAGAQGANYGSYSQEPFAQSTAAYQQPFPQQPGYTPPSQYPPQQSQFSPAQQYPPNQSFPPSGYQQPPFPGGPPHQFGAGAPPGYNPYQPSNTHTPPPAGLPSRPPGLPQAPGLPQRPSFGAQGSPPYGSGPPGAQYPPQHSGWDSNGWSGQDHQNQAMSSAYPPHSQGYNPNAANASSVDDLISSASARQPDDIDEIIRMAEAGIRPPKKAEAPPPRAWAPPPAQYSPPTVQDLPLPPSTAPDSAATPEVSDKKSKKEKDKNAKMIYSDNEVSPEEKMARMPRYAFVPDGKDDAVLVEAAQPGIAGVVDDETE